MLAAALAAVGAEVETLPAVADDEAAHREALARGLAADVLVTSGGVSVGPHDLVRRMEAELGVEEVFWQISVKPGKPVSFGVRGATLVFGLPGNPVSSLVGCELLVKPALRALQGLREPLPRFEPGRLASAVRRGEGRDEFVRARIRRGSETVVLEPLSGQDSHMIVRAASADALVLVPRGEGELAAGAAVSWLRLGSARLRPAAAARRLDGAAAGRARSAGSSRGSVRAAGARLRSDTARSVRLQGRRAVRRRPPTRARSRAAGTARSRG